MKRFVIVLLVLVAGSSNAASVRGVWDSKKTNSLVGLAVFERVQEMAKIERCRKSTEPWEKCHEDAEVESGKAFLAILEANGLAGDCALVKAYDFFPDASRGEDIYNEILRRGKRMLPILTFALTNKPCVPILSKKDDVTDICQSAETYIDGLNKLILDVKAGKKPDPDAE